MLKSLLFIPHNRRAVGKLSDNCRKKTCDVTIGELKKCGEFEIVLVSSSR